MQYDGKYNSFTKIFVFFCMFFFFLYSVNDTSITSSCFCRDCWKSSCSYSKFISWFTWFCILSNEWSTSKSRKIFIWFLSRKFFSFTTSYLWNFKHDFLYVWVYGISMAFVFLFFFALQFYLKLFFSIEKIFGLKKKTYIFSAPTDLTATKIYFSSLFLFFLSIFHFFTFF